MDNTNQGRMPNFKAPDEGLTDFYFIENNEPETIQDLIVRLIKERIPSRFGFNSKTDKSGGGRLRWIGWRQGAGRTSRAAYIRAAECDVVGIGL